MENLKAITLPVKGMDGAANGSRDMDEGWLERAKGEQAVKDSVVAFLARLRSGSASTKTRGTVARSGAKPWRQKGTGRARAGSAGSPVWVGGGVAFGPHPRSYAVRVNRKVEKLALRRSFTERLLADDVILVQDIDLAEAKTKQVLSFLNTVQAGENVLILVDDYTENLYLAARNLPNVLVLKAASVNTYLMLLFKKIVITNAGLDCLAQRLA